MNILLAGTPSFSLKTFEIIINNFNVIGLIAQPDKPVGRKKIITSPPTIELAKKYGIKTFQPQKINQIYDELVNLNFDLFITMAYGQYIPQKILNLATLGSYNIHASLLPKYRGAAPIQYAIANGDKETGITFMEMSSELDAGDILFQESINIENNNYDQVLKKMSDLSSKKIIEWLNNLKDNNYSKISQNNNLVSFAPKISKDDEVLNFDTINNTINKIRSLSSVPGAYIFDKSRNKRIKIFNASLIPIKNSIEIKCIDGIIYANEYQIEGKNKIVVK